MKRLIFCLLSLLPLLAFSQNDGYIPPPETSANAYVSAADDDDEDEPKVYDPMEFRTEVGMNLGITTGLGIAYRHWFNERYGLQVTLLPYKVENNVLITTAATALRSLYYRSSFRAYAYWGNHLAYTNDSYENTTYDAQGNPHTTSHSDPKVRFNTGVGIGISLGRVVAFNAAVGYGLCNLIGPFEHVYISPVGEIGLYWRF